MNEGGETSLLFVRALELTCALPLESVSETMRALPLRILGGLPPYVRGASIIRGEPTPVVDLSVLLGNAPLVRPERYVVLRGGSRLALAVDAVVGVQRAPREALGGLPHLLRDIGEEHVASLLSLDGELVPVLSSAWVLSDEQLKSVRGAVESADESGSGGDGA